MQQTETFLLISGVAFLILAVLLFSTRRKLRNQEHQLTNLTASFFELNDRLLRLDQILELVTIEFEKTKSAPKPSTGKKSVKQRKEQAVKPTSLDVPPPKVQPEVALAAEIITRTTRQDGKTTDTWVSEKVWNEAELTELVSLHRSGKSVQQIAIQLRVDARDVVYGLAREIFACDGDLEDIKSAPNDGKRWLPTDHRKLLELHLAGLPIQRIAFRMGRTQLAIVWRLLDNQRS